MRAPAVLLGLVVLLVSPPAARSAEVLALHPDNPRYLAWRGQPLLVVGSGEHYGAVLNRDFDYRKYLATLAREGLNHTRLFTGAAYYEPEGAFNIARNTLAPPLDRVLAPWARSGPPPWADAPPRFDLERWDETYFARLRDFAGVAGRRRVMVEVNLFCPFYEESQWLLSPFHPDNNVNGAGIGVARTNVYTLDRHGGLLTYQERLVRRVVEELRPFGNLYFEVCNEPYFGGVTAAWQEHIAAVIAEAQAAHPHPKLISRNIANHQARVDRPLPHVSIYNFHYASPPDAVALNWHLERPIGDNETGFRGTNNAPYRMEAWDFILAGGALFSHLDYSFAVGHEDGTFAYPPSQPGGGNPALRRSFRALREFVEAFDFVRWKPDPKLVTAGLPPSHTARAMHEPGRAAAVYLRTSPDPKAPPNPGPPAALTLHLNLAAGDWRATWVDPADGRTLRRERHRHGGGILALETPPFAEDLALRLVRR